MNKNTFNLSCADFCNVFPHPFAIALLFVLIFAAPTFAQSNYFPGANDDWQRRTPEQAQMNAARLAEAVEFAVKNESKAPRDLELAHYQMFGKEPFGEAIGAFKQRGAPTGIILRGGYIVAEYGDTARVDQTFSVTKSFLSTIVGLAFDRKLINSLNDKAADYSAPIEIYKSGEKYDAADKFGKLRLTELFDTDHNRQITWDNLLRQTSDWEGTLWNKPDWADRPDKDAATWLNRKRSEPGSVYEYNDVRVNVLALQALNVWRKPLPEVLKENVMDKIGASNTWRWLGYENSFVVLDGKIIQSVSGGGHWGGGMFISARDMARFGLLTARGGKWRNEQILSAEFIKQARTPTSAQPTYGFMNWFLNTDKKLYPNAPAAAFAHVGNGTNLIYVDPENDLVIVARWIENNKIDEFIAKINQSLK